MLEAFTIVGERGLVSPMIPILASPTSFTIHGFTDELAAALRREGMRAEPLREGSQLELL